MRDVLGVELVLDAGFAENEDGGFGGRRELEDARDVDGSGVGRAEDFILGMSEGELDRELGNAYNANGNAHAVEFSLVHGTTLGAVVGDEY